MSRDAMKAKDLDKLTLPNLREVAVFLGVSVATVQLYVAAGMPGEKGAWPVGPIVRWVVEHKSRESRLANNPESEQLDLERKRLDNASRRLKLMKAADEVVSRKVAAAEMNQLVAVVKGRLLAWPMQVTNSVAPEHRSTVIADLRHQVDLLLRELASMGETNHAD